MSAAKTTRRTSTGKPVTPSTVKRAVKPTTRTGQTPAAKAEGTAKKLLTSSAIQGNVATAVPSAISAVNALNQLYRRVRELNKSSHAISLTEPLALDGRRFERSFQEQHVVEKFAVIARKLDLQYSLQFDRHGQVELRWDD
jgi:hypothetical protein